MRRSLTLPATLLALWLGGAAGAECRNPMMPVDGQTVWVYLEHGQDSGSQAASDTVAVRRSEDETGTITEESAAPDVAPQRYRCEGGAVLPLDGSLRLPGLEVQVLAARGVALGAPADWRVGGAWRLRLDVQASTTGALRLTGKGVMDVAFRVTGQEDLTVAAGHFDAYRVEVTRTLQARLGLLPYQSVTREVAWFAPGVGLVRRETDGQVSELLDVRGE